MGYLIAFDGIDASGKTTQTKMLFDRLKESGYDVLYLKFPDYNSESSAPVRLYLNGELGQNPGDVNAYAASSFFAVDRYISYINNWKSFYDKENAVILTDRYTTANAFHQLPKLERAEWDKFLDWLWDFEFNKLKIPEPDLIVRFDMHIAVALKLIDERADITRNKKDIHESDANYLRKSYEAGKYAADYLRWENLICYDYDGNNKLIPRKIDKINDELFDMVIKKIGGLNK